VDIIEGACTADRVTVLVGESGGGKTFLVLDGAACVADGVDWCGRRTRRGSVVYLSFEGDDLGKRLRALRDKKGRRLADLYVLRAGDPISPRITRDAEQPSVGELDLRAQLRMCSEELASKGAPPIVLLIVDTIRASMVGSEDSSDIVSGYLRAVRWILTPRR
jgi:RecA-family ATPase